MNKKLVAAALGLAFAAPVFADSSNVTLYGRIHQVIDNQSVSDNAGFDKGGNSVISDASSRLGVRGQEDLGGGLSAIFAYEFGVDTDNGAGIGGASRHTYLGMKGGFGTLVIGQQDGGNDSQAPLYNQASLIGSVSNNGGPLTTVGSTNFGVAPATAIAAGEVTTAIARNQRTSNSIGYATNIAGVEINSRYAQLGTNDQGNNVNLFTGAAVAGGKETGTREFEVAATYKLGALTLGGGWQEFDQQGQDPTTAASPERLLQAVASYNFGSFTVGGLVAQTSLAGSNPANGEDSNTEFALSATMPLTANSGIFGMYADSERNNDASPFDVTQLQIAYYYDFSKRTRTYVGFNRLNQEETTGATRDEFDVDNFTVGLRHNF